MKKKFKKIGILGGTFDPPHKGHLYISKIALKKIKLDNLIWVVTKKNPLKKKPYLSLKARINLSKKLTKKEKKIHVKFYENKIKSVNTLKLLKYIKNRNQNAALFFLLGADNLIKFHKWKNWEKIPNFAKLVILFFFKFFSDHFCIPNIFFCIQFTILFCDLNNPFSCFFVLQNGIL